MSDKTHQLPSERPFPLSRLFRRRFVPAFIAFACLFLVLLGFSALQVIEKIYLEQAQRRAQAIANAVEQAAPEPWAHLMAGMTSTDLQNADHAARLKTAFDDEVRERNLPELKVYDLQRHVLFATHADEIGTTENTEALRATIEDSEPRIVTKVLADGTSQYELYVPVFDAGHNARTVFELYEPVTYLDAILINAAVPTMAVPAVLLALLIISLNVLVGRAQRDIDARTLALKALQDRLASFVSGTAIDAARAAGNDGALSSRKTETTIFISDIRDFTGYSEQNAAETVVAFLNDIMGMQVDIIQKHGGDVDKMIGDAVLARFDGDDGPTRAVAAARRIQTAVGTGDYPRRIGIGIHRGEVISGAIGPEQRRDFTMIGDAVNIAARLCALAGIDEIVVDADIADADFGPVETVHVKGRVQGVSVRRAGLS